MNFRKVMRSFETLIRLIVDVQTEQMRVSKVDHERLSLFRHGRHDAGFIVNQVERLIFKLTTTPEHCRSNEQKVDVRTILAYQG